MSYEVIGTKESILKIICPDEDLIKHDIYSFGKLNFKEENRKLYISSGMFEETLGDNIDTMIDFILEHKNEEMNFWTDKDNYAPTYRHIAGKNLSDEEYFPLHFDYLKDIRTMIDSEDKNETPPFTAQDLIVKHPYGYRDGFIIHIALIRDIIALDNANLLIKKEETQC